MAVEPALAREPFGWRGRHREWRVVVATRRICGLVAAAFDAHGRGCGGYGPRLSAMIVGDAAAGRVAKHAFVVGDGYTAVFRDTAEPPRRTRFAGFEVSAVWAARAAAPVA